VEVDARLSRFGLVLDFKEIKPVIRQLVDSLDEHWILPGEHPTLRIERLPDGSYEVGYQERVYRAPAEDVIVLPINNTSAENFATWIGRELVRRLAERFADVHVRLLTVKVEETPGQRGIYRLAQE
jgi:6-pyruvoyltetrahydropterin/6-carboxytetrahydropterin synthase